MTKKSKKEAPDPDFEDLLAEAEALAGKMEEGGLTLDESIRAYEKGVDNLRRCAGLLRAAEEKVQVLLEKNGAFRLEDFESDGDEDDSLQNRRNRRTSGTDDDDTEDSDDGEW